ncbi:MAG: LLM class flavin-dependent oxidoreductase [Gammaproteobacteria bacterium]|jgi:alkanesulfonate monooxygenase SsuD/methylene tetrahydromethanopterin reductase-like flavin-dependent oxidoreductase (luciferase family)
MKFGILFTSHPNADREPYPHRDVHARVTAEIVEADRLGYDTAWIAEHHFSNQYGILPDPFAYMGYLAAKTEQIRLGTAVMTVPLYNPVRIAENTAFVDILSGGRIVLGLGSGYRPYEFEGFGIPFEERRDIQEEAIPLVLDAMHGKALDHDGKYFHAKVAGDYELFPVSVQRPHPPLYMAGGTERSIGFAADHGFGLMLSTLPSAEALAGQIAFYRDRVGKAPAPWNANPACGQVDVARWVYVAETDAEARADSEEGILRHLAHFMGKSTAGYLGSVSEKGADSLNYDALLETTLLHGSPETVTRKLEALRDATGLTSLMLHYPPYYGTEKARKSLRLFAEKVMPRFR